MALCEIADAGGTTRELCDDSATGAVRKRMKDLI